MKKNLLKWGLLISFFSFNTEGIIAQNLFRASVFGGLNFSQIDGDLQKGYKKKDINIGLGCDVILKPNYDISLELFSNPRGTKPNEYGTQASKLYTTIQFKYADVNMLFNFHYIPNKAKTHYIQTLRFGVGYSRLLKSQVDVKYTIFSLTDYEQFLQNNIKKDDFLLILGGAWHFTPRLGLSVRHTNSLTSIFDKKKVKNIQTIPNNEKDFPYLRPYFLSFNIFYHFISPHKIIGIRKNVSGDGGDPLEEL